MAWNSKILLLSKGTLAKSTNAMNIQDAQMYLVLPKALMCFCTLHSLAVHPSVRSRCRESRAKPQGTP